MHATATQDTDGHTCASWRTRWRTRPRIPATRNVPGGLENRYPSLGGSRVRIPPPPLFCKRLGCSVSSALACRARCLARQRWRDLQDRRPALLRAWAEPGSPRYPLRTCSFLARGSCRPVTGVGLVTRRTGEQLANGRPAARPAPLSSTSAAGPERQRQSFARQRAVCKRLGISDQTFFRWRIHQRSAPEPITARGDRWARRAPGP